jgi:hypothetical protein
MTADEDKRWKGRFQLVSVSGLDVDILAKRKNGPDNKLGSWGITSR